MPSAVVEVTAVIVGRVASITISDASSKFPPAGIDGAASNAFPAASVIDPPVTATVDTDKSELECPSSTVYVKTIELSLDIDPLEAVPSLSPVSRVISKLPALNVTFSAAPPIPLIILIFIPMSDPIPYVPSLVLLFMIDPMTGAVVSSTIACPFDKSVATANEDIALPAASDKVPPPVTVIPSTERSLETSPALTVYVPTAVVVETISEAAIVNVLSVSPVSRVICKSPVFNVTVSEKFTVIFIVSPSL